MDAGNCFARHKWSSMRSELGPRSPFVDVVSLSTRKNDCYDPVEMSGSENQDPRRTEIKGICFALGNCCLEGVGTLTVKFYLHGACGMSTRNVVSVVDKCETMR